MNKLDEIRMHYYVKQDEILESYPRCLGHGITIKNIHDLSPIEIRVYDMIKAYNLPLLPQYPVKNFFLDFGDPVKKIAIEVDSKTYHLDKLKDEVRQKEIEREGWTFYRIEGKYTYLEIHEYFEIKTGGKFEEAQEDEKNEFIHNNMYKNSDCLILYLKDQYYNFNYQENSAKEELSSYSELVEDSEYRLQRRIKRRIEWEKMYGKKE